MFKLIIDICRVLSMMKDFEAGYSSSSCDQIMIDYKGKRYMATFKELCDIRDERMIETMNRYWRD